MDNEARVLSVPYYTELDPIGSEVHPIYIHENALRLPALSISANGYVHHSSKNFGKVQHAIESQVPSWTDWLLDRFRSSWNLGINKTSVFDFQCLFVKALRRKALIHG